MRPGPGEEEGGQVGDRPPGVQHQGVGRVRPSLRVGAAELDQQHTGTNQDQLLQQMLSFRSDRRELRKVNVEIGMQATTNTPLKCVTIND